MDHSQASRKTKFLEGSALSLFPFLSPIEWSISSFDFHSRVLSEEALHQSLHVRIKNGCGS